MFGFPPQVLCLLARRHTERAQCVRQPRRWQLFVKLKDEEDHHYEVDRRDRRGSARHFEAFRICDDRVDKLLVGVLYALLPRWVERRGVFQPCGLLRGRRGRAFADGSRVEDRLERLFDPAECGVAPVVESEGTKSQGKLLDELMDERLS